MYARRTFRLQKTRLIRDARNVITRTSIPSIDTNMICDKYYVNNMNKKVITLCFIQDEVRNINPFFVRYFTRWRSYVGNKSVMFCIVIQISGKHVPEFYFFSILNYFIHIQIQKTIGDI